MMAKTVRHYELPVPSTESVTDATLHLIGRNAILRFDYFKDGKPFRSGIRFTGVVATQSRSERCSTSNHMKAFDTLVEVAESSWLEKQRDEMAEMYRNEMTARHFMIYLDSVGCLEVLADDFEIYPEEAGSWESTKTTMSL